MIDTDVFADPVVNKEEHDEFDIDTLQFDLNSLGFPASELNSDVDDGDEKDIEYPISAKMVLDNLELTERHVFHGGSELIYAFLTCIGLCAHADTRRSGVRVSTNDHTLDNRYRKQLRVWLTPVLTSKQLQQLDMVPVHQKNSCLTGMDKNVTSLVLKALAEIHQINIVIWHSEHMDSSVHQHDIILHGSIEYPEQWHPLEYTKWTACQIVEQNPVSNQWCHIQAHVNGSQYIAYV